MKIVVKEYKCGTVLVCSSYCFVSVLCIRECNSCTRYLEGVHFNALERQGSPLASLKYG